MLTGDGRRPLAGREAGMLTGDGRRPWAGREAGMLTPSGRGRRVRRDAGMVTAELAAGLPAVALVLVSGVGAIGVGIDQVRCVDAARLAARALARGDPPGVAGRLVAATAPPGAKVAVTSGGKVVTVTVSARRSLPGTSLTWQVSSSATAQLEQAAVPTGAW